MTPAEWLAFTVLASVVYGILESWLTPDAIRVTVNNGGAALIRICFAVAIVVLALVVLL